jgi:hypothetical protein
VPDSVKGLEYAVEGTMVSKSSGGGTSLLTRGGILSPSDTVVGGVIPRVSYDDEAVVSGGHQYKKGTHASLQRFVTNEANQQTHFMNQINEFATQDQTRTDQGGSESASDDYGVGKFADKFSRGNKGRDDDVSESEVQGGNDSDGDSDGDDGEHMCVCVTCVCVCVSVYMYGCMYVCMCVCVCVCMRTCDMCVCVCVSVYMYGCMYVCMCVYVCVCMRMYVCVFSWWR